MSEETTWIYGLKEEGSDEIRYVGASVDPYVRMGTHLRGSSRAMKDWVECCRDRGVDIQLVCIEEVSEVNGGRGKARHPVVAEAEDRWMVILLDEGHRLVNKRLPSVHSEAKKEMKAAIERGRAMFGPQ